MREHPRVSIDARCAAVAAFERHAGLLHTVQFLERVQTLIDHPLDVTRSEQVG